MVIIQGDYAMVTGEMSAFPGVTSLGLWLGSFAGVGVRVALQVLSAVN